MQSIVPRAIYLFIFRLANLLKKHGASGKQVSNGLWWNFYGKLSFEIAKTFSLLGTHPVLENGP